MSNRDQLKEKLKEKAGEKLQEKIGDVSLMQRKRFWMAVIVVAVAYFGFCPAPENAESKIVVGIANTITRAVLTVGMKLAMEFNQMERGIGLIRALGQPTPIADRVEHSVVQRENYEIHIFKPTTHDLGDAAGAIVAIHGGGWTVGNVPNHFSVYSAMAVATGAYVFAPEYRLSPEHKFPAAFDDSLDTILFVDENAEKYGIDRTNIVVTGDSAGGQLTLSIGLAAEENGVILKGLAPVYPATQAIFLGTPSYQENDKHLLSIYAVASFLSSYLTGSNDALNSYLNGDVVKSALKKEPELAEIFELGGIDLETPDEDTPDLTDDLINALDFRMSPLFAYQEQLTGLPNTRIYVAEHDVLKNDGELMFERMKDWELPVELIIWEGALHGAQVLSQQSAGVNAVPEVTQMIDNYFADLRKMLQ